MTRPVNIFVIVLVLLLGVTSASAWDGVEVTAVDGSFERIMFGSASPTPWACWWFHGDSPDLLYHVTNDEADEMYNECDDPWLAHCDSDSLTYQGAWLPIQCWTCNLIEHVVELSCTVVITKTTRLTAQRSIIAEGLVTDEHHLTLTHPDGSTQQLLAEATGPDHVQLILPPGQYEAALHVWARGFRIPHTDFILPYEGWVSLSWEDPESVAVEPMVWSSVKALYR